jgi:hypothetical protein
MADRPKLTTARTVAIFETMLSYRRIYCADSEFFNMADFWEDLCEGNERFLIKRYRSNSEDSMRKARVVALDDRVTLTVDEKLLTDARQGSPLSNYILAHEFGHLALDHHAKQAVTKHFDLKDRGLDFAIVPPTVEELEATYTGVFLQCGSALADIRREARDLARRAKTDVYLTQKLQKMVQLDVFQRELNRPKTVYPRVVL